MKLYPKGRKTYHEGIKYEGRKTYPICRVYYSYPKGWIHGRPLKVLGKPTPYFSQCTLCHGRCNVQLAFSIRLAVYSTLWSNFSGSSFSLCVLHPTANVSEEVRPNRKLRHLGLLFYLI